MFLTAKNFGLQEENINISKPQGKTKQGTTEREFKRDRPRDRKREKEGGRTQCFMKKEAPT